MNDLDEQILHLGSDLRKKMSGETPGLFQKDYWQGRILEWAMKDPILRLRKRMVDQNWFEEAALDQMLSDIRDEVDQAVEWADQSPFPDPSELLDNVYEIPAASSGSD